MRNSIKVWCAFLALFGIIGAGCGGGGSNPPPPPPAAIDVRPFLNTLVCTDGTLAALTGCPNPAVLNGSMPLVFHRYDWAHADQAQVQDTWLLSNGSGWAATFSYPPHGPFVPANGDGGDVYVVDGRNVRISYTQNGNGSGGTIAGWWVGARCGGTGWLSYDDQTNDRGWREWTARLKGAFNPNDCPNLDTAYTRARVVRQMPVYFILQDIGTGAVTTKTVPLDAVVTEHYAGRSIEASTQMERQIHLAGVGPSVYWEGWIKNPPTPPASFACDGAPDGWSGPPPGAGWVLWDRRCRTVVRQALPVTSGDAFGWPPADATK